MVRGLQLEVQEVARVQLAEDLGDAQSDAQDGLRRERRHEQRIEADVLVLDAGAGVRGPSAAGS